MACSHRHHTLETFPQIGAKRSRVREHVDCLALGCLARRSNVGFKARPQYVATGGSLLVPRKTRPQPPTSSAGASPSHEPPSFRQLWIKTVSYMKLAHRFSVVVCLLTFVHTCPANTNVRQLYWLDNYASATEVARQSGKQLFLWIGPATQPVAKQLWSKVNADPKFKRATQDFVFAHVTSKELLNHKSLQEMLGKEGVVIIDYSNSTSTTFGHVFSVFPFRQKVKPTHRELQLLLTLPRGTLTQRTLIFAVRKHYEGPRSTNGRCLPLLMSECQKHSQHQADILSQGHHNWESRFQEITAKLPGGDLVAQEVCAESWPGEKLLEAAEECVHSWRQSDGHWSAVSGTHRFYGYDMKRGKDGIWYATGIFGTNAGQ